jgi:thiol-disulfide isomerase/thioredoxin
MGKTIKRDPVAANNQSIKVVEMWATWCPPCKKSIPLLTQAQQVYGTKNVVFYGFTSEADEALVTNFVREKGATMNYNVQLDSAKKTVGPFSAIWNVGTIPHVYVISHRGKIVWQGNPLSTRTFERAIQETILLRDGTL